MEPDRLCIMKPEFEVVGAVIVTAGRVLCTQRGSGDLAGLWEFPGGKVEVGERPQEALVREILEELGCTVQVGNEVARTSHEYDFAVVNLATFYCIVTHGEPAVREHAEARWVPPSELAAFGWAPADIPSVRRVQADFA